MRRCERQGWCVDQLRSSQNGDSHDQGARAARLSLIGIDTAVPPGSHTWSVECTEDSGRMQYFDLAIAAVEL